MEEHNRARAKRGHHARLCFAATRDTLLLLPQPSACKKQILQTSENKPIQKLPILEFKWRLGTSCKIFI